MKDSLSYEDVPVKSLNSQVRRFKNEEVASVRFCISHSIEGSTWELKAAMNA